MGSSIEIYYAAAVRSMSMSWHDFSYAAFDPAGTVSIDKLPGAFWIQALSARLFGFHAWAIALPQVLEGSLTVLVLYRTVRRLAGAQAAIGAAAVLALSPATVALNRGNISDTLLILLLVLAADSIVDAIITGRRRSLGMTALWVGLAFQAKMLEAWLVVPAFALAYLIARAGSWWSRTIRLATMVAAIVVVSLSWMVFVSLTPANQRPYVDGSQHDSVFSQVFEYNGFGRVGQPSANTQLGETLDIPLFKAPLPAPAWNRLLTGPYGLDTGWLLPTALGAAALGLALSRRKARTDLVRAGIILWGTWLVILWVVFSVSATINPYYLAALSPPIAGLLGMGAKEAWDNRQSVAVRIALMTIGLVTAVYAYWLLPDSGTGLPSWLRPSVLGIGIATAVVIAATLVFQSRVVSRAIALASVGVGALLVPAVASASVVSNRLGFVDTPFQPVSLTDFTKSFFGAPLKPPSTLPEIESVRNGATDLLAAQTSVLAAVFIYATGQEVLPIGGYTGNIPEPSVSQLASMVRDGEFHLVLTAEGSRDGRVLWIADHCLKVTPVSGGEASGAVTPLQVFYCTEHRANERR